MAYLPLNGRRATLAFFTVVAAGATMAGLGLDRDGKMQGVASQAEVPLEPQAVVENGTIPVVNADGSLRRPEDTPATSADGSGLDDEAPSTEQGDAMDEAPASDGEADWAAPDRQLPQEAAGRIE